MSSTRMFFFFNDTATTEIYTLSLHDALPISRSTRLMAEAYPRSRFTGFDYHTESIERSEEHTSEHQSRLHLVCRLLLEKKKKQRPRCTRRQYKPTVRSKSHRLVPH